MKLILFFLLLVGTYRFSLSMQEEECLICTEKLFLAPHLQLHCKHSYHRDCWDGWVFSENTRMALYASMASTSHPITCPYCYNVVDQSQVIYGQARTRKEIIARVKQFFLLKTHTVEPSK